MLSVERPSETGSPQWSGPHQRQLRFALSPDEVQEYHNKGLSYFGRYSNLMRLRSINKRLNKLLIKRFY